MFNPALKGAGFLFGCSDSCLNKISPIIYFTSVQHNMSHIFHLFCKDYAQKQELILLYFRGGSCRLYSSVI